VNQNWVHKSGFAGLEEFRSFWENYRNRLAALWLPPGAMSEFAEHVCVGGIGKIWKLE